MYSDTTAAGTSSAVAAATEMQMAEVLAAVLRTERVPVDGDFFTDLGAPGLRPAGAREAKERGCRARLARAG